MPLIELPCPRCKKIFSIKPSRLKDGYKKYCSRHCAHLSTRKGKLVKCHACKDEVYKSLKALKGSKSGTFFCTKSCQTKWRNNEYKGEKHSNWKGGTHAYRRIMMQGGTKPLCRLCKTGDIRILAVHHIDENRSNNVIENLAWLCHNCHLLVHHYPGERKKFMATIV